METRRDIFHAISDPTRRAIILLLAVNTLTPNALAVHFASSRQAVSKHIRILTECELLIQNQQGREIYYQLNTQKMAEIDDWLDQFKQLFNNRFDQLDNVLNQLKINKNE